ncbi:SpoIIE family protein phosphatase [Leptolyngbya sp. AN02str]|uniref:PP2C family protein-serine/threonine phosphatase n=1 Tax=Leptolyngbya sp. AN02str TaxID=3423363 RepID=UPI003D3235BC
MGEAFQHEMNQLRENIAALQAQNLALQQELAACQQQRQAAEIACQNSEAEFRSLLSAMPDITLVFNREGRCLKILAPINESVFYLPPTDQIGKTIYETLPKAQADWRMQLFHQCLETQETIVDLEYRLDVKGQEHWYSAAVSPLPPDRVVWVARDITERKLAEKNLVAANQQITELNQQLQADNRRMETELEVTRRLQQLILPRQEELNQILELDIAGFMESATEVGGDYYDVLHDNGKIRIGIGDVTGHGLESSMVMLMAQTAIRTLITNGETDPVKLLNTVNRIIYDNTHRMRSPKNMTLALLEYEAGMLRLSGQHEELIIVRADGHIEPIDTLDLGFPLGIESDISAFVAGKEIQLHSGDVAVLYTDGISEAMNGDRVQYGLERLYTVLKRYHHNSAQAIRKAVIEDVKQHIGSEQVFDDLTLLVLKQY